MRAGNLARIAAEAEVLRIKHMVARQARRAAFALVAAVFLMAVLVLGNVVGWQVLVMYVAPIYATLILLGINLLLAALFGLLAAGSKPSRTERDALAVRQRALVEARNSLVLTSFIPILGALLRLRRQGTGSGSGGGRLSRLLGGLTGR